MATLYLRSMALVVGHGAGEQADLPVGLQAEKAWYEAHREDLLRRYRGEYLAIVNQRVIDHDKAFGALARRVFERVGVRPVFMPKCSERERAARLPSPRLVRA